MSDAKEHTDSPEFTTAEGMALALSYLNDPADVPCPDCGPGTIEIVAYLDAQHMAEGTVIHANPEGEYTVVLYCHGCRRAAALDLSVGGGGGLGGGPNREAA